ncbi:MAG: DUF4411 family protein [Proteobacteria bacterium]|nr:DUF4411 family protein [Pseudomonadota bacterium]
MVVPRFYVVDSDVFITAKNRYYAFDICPGFWKSVIPTDSSSPRTNPRLSLLKSFGGRSGDVGHAASGNC